MKPALMNYHYLRCPIKESLDKVESSPSDSIDLYCSVPQLNIFDYSLGRSIELDRDIRQRNLKVMAVTSEDCAYPVNFCTQDPMTRQSSIRYYQRTIDTVEFLGYPNIQISTGSGCFDQPRGEVWKHCQESPVQLVVYYQRRQVRLFLEKLKVTATNVLITSKDIARILDEVGSPCIVGMVGMDRMTHVREVMDDYFDHPGERLMHIHFNDRGHTTLGCGDFPMREYYDAIKRRRYGRAVSFEIYDRRYYCDPDKAIDDIVSWMKKNTHELGGVIEEI